MTWRRILLAAGKRDAVAAAVEFVSSTTPPPPSFGEYADVVVVAGIAVDDMELSPAVAVRAVDVEW